MCARVCARRRPPPSPPAVSGRRVPGVSVDYLWGRCPVSWTLRDATPFGAGVEGSEGWLRTPGPPAPRLPSPLY